MSPHLHSLAPLHAGSKAAPQIRCHTTRTLLALLLAASPALADAQVVTTNPLDAIKARVEEVLRKAGQPFTEQQQRALALVLEEQRQASERLFGAIMDFSGGPVRGADRDKALAGIQWMNEAFEAKLQEVLTPEQNRIWAAFRAAEVRSQGGFPALRLILEEAGVPLSADQGRRLSSIFAGAAQRLRRAAEQGAGPRGTAAIEQEALEQAGAILTEAQAAAVVAAAARAPADAGAAADSAIRDDPDAARAMGAAGSPEARRLTLLQALGLVARPTSTFVVGSGAGSAAATSSAQIAQIRINANPYSAENFGGRGNPLFGGGFAPGRFGGPGGGGPGGGGPGGGPGRGGGGRGGGGSTSIEVIQRGGIGDYHGNFAFNFRDEALTARNAFASNKPPFQQRNINANVSGPFIRNVLSASVTFNQTEQENFDTVVATTPAGDVAFGIVRPAVSRSYSGSGQLQMSARHALHFVGRYNRRHGRNNGVGGFTLPERAWDSTNRDMNLGVRELWVISPKVLHEVIFTVFNNSNANVSATRDVAINVLDAFRAGGAGQDGRRNGRNMTLTNLFWYEGERLTFKGGTEVNHRRATSESREGFQGSFTFASLEDFVLGRPITYRVTRGNPHLDVRQTEPGVFVQTDWRLTRRFTFFAGMRYEWVTTLDDFDNVDPRLAFAYSVGRSTVVRGGAGVFHQNFNLNTLEDVLRLDGTRQYELVVSDPSYPDPFAAGGAAEVIPPRSRRVLAPNLSIPYEVRASLSVERTLPGNMTVDGAYEFNRGVERYLSRNLNAPRPGEATRLNPDDGNILQLESTGRSRTHRLRLGVRQRLSFMTYNVSWTLGSEYNDTENPFYVPMNSYDPRADWGRAGSDARHRYAFTVNLQAPLGTLLTLDGDGHSGVPYTITTGYDDNGDQTTNDRPPGVARNSGNGPRYFNVDATLSKTFRFGARDNRLLSIYANVSNAFNLVNLRNPSGVMTSKYFGIPTSAADARDVELGIRYQF